MIDVHLTLHNLEEAREELRKSLKRRKDIAIAENDTHYKEIDTKKVFSNGDTQEFDAAIEELMERNKAQVEEIRSLTIEWGSQAMMLCEIIEWKKRAIGDRAIIEDTKRNLVNILEKKLVDLQSQLPMTEEELLTAWANLVSLADINPLPFQKYGNCEELILSDDLYLILLAKVSLLFTSNMLYLYAFWSSNHNN